MTVIPSADLMDTESEAKGRQMVFIKMEKLVREMQHPETGVPVRSHKTILTLLPCVFMGYDLIEWLMDRLPMDDSVPELKTLTVKDDGSYYRFQTPYFWPSQTQHLDSTEYAIYLVKRSMRNKQKHGLDEYEQETLNKLKKTLATKWEFVSLQADEQLKLTKERKKVDKIVVDSQEKAYWKVHWAQTGASSASTVEAPLTPYPHSSFQKKKRTKEGYHKEISRLKEGLNRGKSKSSQAAETLIHQCEVYAEYDPLVSALCPSNPWISDDPTYWMLNEPIVETPTEKRVRRWAISLNDLLSDPTGIEEFENYLRKEYSHENIRFWKAVKELHSAAISQLDSLIHKIYRDFLVTGAPCEVNLDSKTVEMTQQAMSDPNRYTFDNAQQHVFSLMNKDSYPRFIRSETYKSLLANAIQPSHKKRFFNFGGVTKKKNSPSGGGNYNIHTSSNVADRKTRDVSLSGSTSDLREQHDNEWGSSSSNIMGHSLSASNLHDLNSSDSPYRLSNTTGCGGTLNVTKPKALSTESCNTTVVQQPPVDQKTSGGLRPMELTLEVPSGVLGMPHRSGSLTPETRRSSTSSVASKDPSVGEGSSPQHEYKGQRNDQCRSSNEVCPWEEESEENRKQHNEVCPWDDA